MIDTAWKEWKARNPGAFHANGDVWTAPADERDGGPLNPVPYCKLLPEQAFPAAPFEPPPHTADPKDYPLVSAVLASRCAGMVLAPKARDLYEGLRADEPSPIHRAAIRTLAQRGDSARDSRRDRGGRVLGPSPRTRPARARRGRRALRSCAHAQPLLSAQMARDEDARRPVARRKVATHHWSR